MASTTPAASAEDIAKHGWTAVPVDADAILKGRPYVHRPRPRLVGDMPFPSDDPVVARVQQYAKEHLIPQTYHHSMRVYYWGMSRHHQHRTGRYIYPPPPPPPPYCLHMNAGPHDEFGG